ncbi:hypothetical protein Pmani_021574 [Petrolisthes manimaculis]|uniref:Major facilitator superfamily domain-containing protein 12-like n=1 Tax=Petrolisthes manimaculis TaxID=1843537 RepID=A0AAE1PEH9_9EUCA|nr:hypothetical protein Pmani_021574 [Petrolisthes manimaculis]
MLTRRVKYGYGVGHVLNDLCSAIWFTYLLIYFHHVLLFDNSLSGVVLLIGQVADALSTPFVGREADRTDDLPFCVRYGRRKTWHLVGTILVLAAFPMIFMGCLVCSGAQDWAQVIYYSPFVVIFQFGWAATQISHLALIPTITQDPHDRTELNAIRYGFTVMSNVVVYSVTWLVLGLDTTQGGITPEDASKFRYIVVIILIIGAMFAASFHILVKENNNYTNLGASSPTPTPACVSQDPEVSSCAADALPSPAVVDVPPHFRMKAMDWFRESQFYQVALVYMGTRLFCNLTQAYVPIYLQDSLHLKQTSVAVIPLVMYISGFLTTMLIRPLNKKMGRKASFLLGAILGCSGCVWLYLGNGEVYSKYLVYPMACLLGSGGSVMLVTSLSLTADLIGPNVESGAFVYGAMSFTDKLSNGIAVMLIQSLNPCTMPRLKYPATHSLPCFHHHALSTLQNFSGFPCLSIPATSGSSYIPTLVPSFASDPILSIVPDHSNSQFTLIPSLASDLNPTSIPYLSSPAHLSLTTPTPYRKCCPQCSLYYRGVLTFCCGGAAILASLGVLSLLSAKIGHRSRHISSTDEESASRDRATPGCNPDLPPYPLSPNDMDGWQGEGAGQEDKGDQGEGELTHNLTHNIEHTGEEYQAVPQGLRARLPSDPIEDVVI